MCTESVAKDPSFFYEAIGDSYQSGPSQIYYVFEFVEHWFKHVVQGNK